MMRLRGDDGSTLPLVAGFTALTLVVVLLVSAASSLYLERKRLLSVADGAALVGAEAFEFDQVTFIDGTVVPRLESSRVAAAVQGYLDAEPTVERSQVQLVEAGTPDGRSASVTLAARWTPPIVTAFIPDGVPLRVTSTARSVFR